MNSIILCEKPSQARNLRAALGDRHGRILAAQAQTKQGQIARGIHVGSSSLLSMSRHANGRQPAKFEMLSLFTRWSSLNVRFSELWSESRQSVTGRGAVCRQSALMSDVKVSTAAS